MALWDRLMLQRAIEPIFEEVTPIQARTIADMDLGSATLDDLLQRVAGVRNNPWRAASVREAMGTPAIFRAISLIANTTGMLSMEAFRGGVKMDPADGPRVIQRPDPFRTPRAFHRDGGYYLASRGELWWWVAKRDTDGQALSLIAVPPWEVVVEPNQQNRLKPRILWLDKEMPRENMRLITYLPDESTTANGPFQRGIGPLQLCGAAVSVAVESQEWAANYYAGGGVPPIIIKAAGELGQADSDASEEAALLKSQWMESDPNVPHVIDQGIEDISSLKVDVNGAQMLDARQYEVGDASRMFGIPGSLLEYQQAGGSLTYQNLEGEFTKFLKTCLAPGYLEPIEQEMSDLLTRSTVARFAVSGFLRADAKTRAETYNLLVPLGVLTVPEARQAEGLDPGNVEYAPVPAAPPQAVPSNLPVTRTAARTVAPEVRCDGTRMLRGILRPCGKLLAEHGPFIGRCPRCSKQHQGVA